MAAAVPEEAAPVVAAEPRFLYVASGVCYSGGGNTTFTNLSSSNLIYKINLASGRREAMIADYNQTPAQIGDSPVGIVSSDADHLYVALENTTSAGARRIEKIEKKGSFARTTFSNNITALSAQLRSIDITPTGDLLISKSTAVEKITSANVRLMKGANAYVQSPGGACATSTTLFSKTLNLDNGMIIYLHAATGQNRIGMIAAAGYSVVADCKAAVAAPNAASFPVAAAYDKVNSKLLVAYAGSSVATDINSIYAYNVNEGSATITNPQKIYDSALYPSSYPYLLYGISEMALDSENKTLYVATAVSTATTLVNYAIEKLTYDSTQIGVTNTAVLTRVGSTPFYPYGSDTKCISSMFVGP